MKDGPLDMRMDRSGSVTAADIVNGYEVSELARIIKTYGEERYSRPIAEAIARERAKKPVETTLQLADIIGRAVPHRARHTGGNPAMRTFQALRIEVNHELDGLESLLQDGIRKLKPGGRMAIISFHSLEDRIVKEAFRTAESPCTCPRDFPVCVCGKKSLGTVITKKPIEPTQEEIDINPRARSSKLRVFERNDNEQYN